MYKLPEMGGRRGGGKVIRAMPKRKHSFLWRCSLIVEFDCFSSFGLIGSIVGHGYEITKLILTYLLMQNWNRCGNLIMKVELELLMHIYDNEG